MAAQLPVTNEPDRQFEVVLGDNLLTVRTYFNTVARTWFMDLYDGNDNPLALGLALVPLINVLEASPQLTQALGQFRILTTDGGENDTADSLGVTGLLYWFAPGEFEAQEVDEVVLTPLPFNVADLYHV